MTLVMDTSILIDIERRKEETINKLNNLIKKYPSPAKITFINEFEFKFGLEKHEPKNKEKALVFLNNFSVIQTSKKTAGILAKLKYKYDRKGIVIPLADLLIASLVIENSMVLLTKDNDFLKIEELEKIVL